MKSTFTKAKLSQSQNSPEPEYYIYVYKIWRERFAIWSKPFLITPTDAITTLIGFLKIGSLTMFNRRIDGPFIQRVWKIGKQAIHVYFKPPKIMENSL